MARLAERVLVGGQLRVLRLVGLAFPDTDSHHVIVELCQWHFHREVCDEAMVVGRKHLPEPGYPRDV